MSDLTPREARTVWALLKIRQAEISAALKAVARFTEQEPGDKNMAKLGAARLGRVAMTEPDVKPHVRDRIAFTKYVTTVAATEIETVEQVRPAYEAKLLAEVLARGAAVDGNGEEIPGVVLDYASTPSQRFYPEENAGELLRLVEARDLPDMDDVDLVGILGARPAGPREAMAGEAS